MRCRARIASDCEGREGMRCQRTSRVKRVALKFSKDHFCLESLGSQAAMTGRLRWVSAAKQRPLDA